MPLCVCHPTLYLINWLMLISLRTNIRNKSKFTATNAQGQEVKRIILENGRYIDLKDKNYDYKLTGWTQFAEAIPGAIMA